MTQYYYDKFNAIGTPVYSHSVQWSAASNSGYNSASGYTSYSIDGTGKIVLGGSYLTIQQNTTYGTIYTESGGSLIKFTIGSHDNVIYETWGSVVKTQISTTYSKGSLVQSNIVAEDGTYPANGRHTDGYWYVKGAAVGPLPPGQVINLPYNISGSMGRKLVRLKDGTYFVAVRSSTTEWKIFKSTNKGDSFSEFVRKPLSVGDIALATDGTRLFVAHTYSSIGVKFFAYNADGTIIPGIDPVNGKDIDKAQGSMGGISLTVDQTTGHIYAAWASVYPALYPNSSNIRFAKSIDYGVSWSTVEQVTTVTVSGSEAKMPSIVVHNGVVTIINSQVLNNNQYLMATTKNGGVWESTFIGGGIQSYGQLNPSAVVDKNGTIHVLWVQSGIIQLFYSKKAIGGTWSAPVGISDQQFYGISGCSITVDKNNNIFATWHQKTNSTYTDINIKKNSNGVWGAVKKIQGTAANLEYPSTLVDDNFDIIFGDVPPMVYMVYNKSVEYTGTYTSNNSPTISISLPSNNQTLYENDTMYISGDAYDADKDQSVTVFYQINGEQRKVLATNVSQTQITLSKQLTFKDGKLFDGETALTGTLAEGVAHTLKVWAVDSENGQSATIERAFYVIPNRAPLLTIDAVVPSGVVDADKFKISGTSSDQDANATVKVTKKVNATNPVEIYSGPGGAWEFDVSLAELVIGENTIVVEVIDNYGAKTSKTIKLKKNEVKTPILHAVARYKVTPPTGSAKGVLLFIERDEDMDLKVELSMTLAGEQEQYETLTADNTAPMPNTNGIVEDTYYHEVTEPKDNIILKLSTTRPDATVNHKIHLISGAIE